MNFFQKFFQKADNEKVETELYQYLAMLNHFIEVKENIYVNKKGERFLLTKYGFKPIVQQNLQLLTEQLQREVLHLDLTNTVLKRENEKLSSSNLELIDENHKLNKIAIELLNENRILKYTEHTKQDSQINHYEKIIDKLKNKYANLIHNNHYLIALIKDKKVELKRNQTQLTEERSKSKELRKKMIALSQKYKIVKNNGNL